MPNVEEKGTQNAKNSLCVVGAETLLVLLPFVVIAIVLAQKGEIARLPYMPEWGMASIGPDRAGDGPVRHRPAARGRTGGRPGLGAGGAAFRGHRSPGAGAVPAGAVAGPGGREALGIPGGDAEIWSFLRCRCSSLSPWDGRGEHVLTQSTETAEEHEDHGPAIAGGRRLTARHLLHQHIDGLEAGGDARRIKAGEHGHAPDREERDPQQRPGRVELDGPAEALLVDHEDQQQR